MLRPSTRTSAVVSSIFCLKSFHVPFRFETKRTALLSDVHASATLPFASNVRRRREVFSRREPASNSVINA